jgi:hypothetical protein
MFARMKRIFRSSQDGLYPNCTSIAWELEVSAKTAARDVECLRDEWELPIGYDDKRHGFYFTEKVDRLPYERSRLPTFATLCATVPRLAAACHALCHALKRCKTLGK